MTINNLRILAVVPARGGSKGIIRKNMRKVCGKSLIEHTVDCINQLDWLDESVLSTEDHAIAEHGKSLGLKVPCMRPEELAGDFSNSIDAWKHAWLTSEEYFNTTFDISVLLQPTSPMRIPEDIRDSVNLLIEKNAYSVATVSQTPADFTPHKTLKFSETGTLSPFLEDGLKYSIRQNIPDLYHRNGICYAVTRESLINHNNLIEKNCYPLLINRFVVNIDEEIDIKIAEHLLGNIENNP